MLMVFVERRVYEQYRESSGEDEHKEKGNSHNHAVSLKTWS